MSAAPAAVTTAPSILIYAQRDRARSMARSIFPRRRHRVVLTRTAVTFEQAFRESLIDAAI
ncbi:MAG TPA: hypothetical protein VGL13_17670, partial [Polyangiaceae bacterium]